MYAKKSLGQNFLKSGSALHSIIVAGNITPDDIILEIGPGKGALTAKLLETSAKVIAIEKDHDLIPYLSEKFFEQIKSKQLILMEGDVLDLSVKDIFKQGLKTHHSQLTTNLYKLIANIPYYITGEIIRKFLEEDIQPSRMVLLVQKEVAMRIVAKDKKESILSMSVKAYGKPEYIKTVKRENFHPAPNVDSAIILIDNINKDLFGGVKLPQKGEKRFFEVMKLGFAHKRKKLGGNLKEIKETLNQEKFEQIKDKRAEDIELSDWIDLIKK